jgi:cathepsin C
VLEFPNTAIDEFGNVGFWTIIYNQVFLKKSFLNVFIFFFFAVVRKGFEVVLNGRKYFAFSYYEQNGNNITSYCYKTFPGWSHDVGVNPINWSCYKAIKNNSSLEVPSKTKTYQVKYSNLIDSYYKTKTFKTNIEFVNKINIHQSSWTARNYDFLEGKSIEDLIRMAGGKKSKILR